MKDYPKRILVVDDHILNRNLLKRRLLKEEFEVIEADGGEAALREVEIQKPDLILLDIVMPGMDGNSVLSTIREKYNYYELPIIMVTSKEENEDIAKSFTLGANDYITKPVKMSIASARINTQLKLSESFNEYKEIVDLKEIRKNSEQISDMFGHISHEVNNPLTVVKGNLQLLNGFKDKLDPQKIERLIGITNDAISRIGVFFQSIQPFVNPGQETYRDASSVTSIKKLEKFLLNLPEKLSSLKVVLSPEFSKDINVRMNQTAMERIFSIILDNAYDALSDVGMIESPVLITCVSEGDKINFSVANSGVPIPDDIAPMIFDPFFTTKEVGQGIGIGLTEAKSLIEKFGGEISLQNSTPDKTVFSLVFLKHEENS